MIGLESGRDIRYGMAAVAAASQASIPWAVVQIHKALESAARLIMRQEPMF